jgi:hypothetical protein
MTAPFLSYMIAGLLISLGMLLLAGPDAVRASYASKGKPPLIAVIAVMALFWPWCLWAAFRK